MPKLKAIPPPKKRGPAPKCDCGICKACQNRIRVMRHYYGKKKAMASDEK